MWGASLHRCPAPILSPEPVFLCRGVCQLPSPYHLHFNRS